ncbi:protein ABHD18-like [Convolutriloba macropyga]|uniref:protein ABHD18-like n=1 Tax=Convolutriloba macropyga TaxID=536237 RepID=UPI003F523A0B
MIAELAYSFRDVSSFDKLFRHLNLFKIFVNGWSDGNNLVDFFNLLPTIQKRSCFLKLSLSAPIEFSNDSKSSSPTTDCLFGKFESPLNSFLNLRKECQTCHFWACIPKNRCRSVVLHFAGTGDHYYLRRKLSFANPLLEHNIGSIVIENPFYGKRKPRTQFRSQLNYVSDLLIMGTALVMEANVLMNFVEKENFGFPALTGISLGGYTSSLAATAWSKPVPLIPCLSWTTSANVYTQGILSSFVNWPKLRQNMPDLSALSQNPDLKILLDSVNGSISAETLLYQILEVSTHLSNYSPLVDPKLATVVVAEKDAYIPRNTDDLTNDVWPGATRVNINVGHMQGIFMHTQTFLKAILETVERYESLYPTVSKV